MMPKDRICCAAVFEDWRHDRGRRKDGGSGTATRTVVLGGIPEAQDDAMSEEKTTANELLLSYHGRKTFWRLSGTASSEL